MWLSPRGSKCRMLALRMIGWAQQSDVSGSYSQHNLFVLWSVCRHPVEFFAEFVSPPDDASSSDEEEEQDVMPQVLSRPVCSLHYMRLQALVCSSLQLCLCGKCVLGLAFSPSLLVRLATGGCYAAVHMRVQACHCNCQRGESVSQLPHAGPGCAQGPPSWQGQRAAEPWCW